LEYWSSYFRNIFSVILHNFFLFWSTDLHIFEIFSVWFCTTFFHFGVLIFIFSKYFQCDFAQPFSILEYWTSYFRNIFSVILHNLFLFWSTDLHIFEIFSVWFCTNFFPFWISDLHIFEIFSVWFCTKFFILEYWSSYFRNIFSVILHKLFLFWIIDLRTFEIFSVWFCTNFFYFGVLIFIFSKYFQCDFAQTFSILEYWSSYFRNIFSVILHKLFLFWSIDLHIFEIFSVWFCTTFFRFGVLIFIFSKYFQCYFAQPFSVLEYWSSYFRNIFSMILHRLLSFTFITSDIKILWFTFVQIIYKNTVPTSLITNLSARKWKELMKTEIFHIAFDTYQFH